MKAKITNKRIINKRKIIKIIISILTVLTILFFIYCVLWRVDILADIKVKYLHNYRDYYYTTKVVVKNTLITWQSAHRQIIYIKIGQKGKMLEKIKEDITYYLEKTIEEHGDIFYKYEISDDFKQLRIYETSNDIYINNRSEIGLRVITRIQSLLSLYHSIKIGSSASMPTDFMFEIISPIN